MKKNNFNTKLILSLLISCILIMNGCKQFGAIKNSSFNKSYTLINFTNLTKEEKNLIKIEGADNFYIFEVKNP